MGALILRRLTSAALLFVLVAAWALRDRCPMDPRVCGSPVDAAQPCHGGRSEGWRAATPRCCHAAPKNDAPARLDQASVVLAPSEMAATAAAPTDVRLPPSASSPASLRGHGPPVHVLRI